MLSTSTLNRVSNSYRRGYYDGYYGREANSPVNTAVIPFSNFDYDKGYKAGANDAKWANRK